MAWMQECNSEFDVVTQRAKPSENNQQKSIVDHVVQDIALGVATNVMYSGLKHAAQSQIKGRLGMALRVGGRVGMRAVPILGTAMAAYSIYDFLVD